MSSYSISSERLSARLTKLAGPFSDTCRFSISPRSRLRLRPARRAALIITFIRADCSMIPVFANLVIDVSKGTARSLSDGERTSARWHRRALNWVPCGGAGVKADHAVPSLFGAQPSARAGLGLGAILRAHIGKGVVEHRVALAGGFRHDMPFQALDLVDRGALSAREGPGQPILRDRVVLLGGLAQQRDRGRLV